MTKRNSGDQPMHHFRGLLDHLATLAKNTGNPKAGRPPSINSPFLRRCRSKSSNNPKSISDRSQNRDAALARFT